MPDIQPHELGGPTPRLCRVWSPKRCDSPGVLSGNGFDLPLCEYHLRLLPRPMFDELVRHSGVSVWDTAGVTVALAHLRTCMDWIRKHHLKAR